MKHLKFIAGLSALAFVCALVPTMASAADPTPTVKPFGEVDLYAGYDRSDYKGKHNSIDDGIIGSSNLGFNFTYDKITGKAAIGLKGMYDDRKVVSRDIWANYDNDFYSVQLGQFTAPCLLWSNEAAFYNNSGGFGALDMDFAVQAKFTVKGAYIDFIKSNYAPLADDTTTTDYDESAATARTDVPIVAVGYDFKNDSVNIGAGALGTYFNKNEVYYSVSSSGDETNRFRKTYSWLGYGHVSLTLGDFTILANGGYGQNVGNIKGFYGAGAYSSNMASISDGVAGYDLVNEKAYNTKHYEGFVEFGYAATKALAFHLGAGAAKTTGMKVNATGVNTRDDKAYQGYLNAYYTVNDHLTLAPEVAYYKFPKGTSVAKDASNIFAGVLAIAAF